MIAPQRQQLVQRIRGVRARQPNGELEPACRAPGQVQRPRNSLPMYAGPAGGRLSACPVDDQPSAAPWRLVTRHRQQRVDCLPATPGLRVQARGIPGASRHEHPPHHPAIPKAAYPTSTSRQRRPRRARARLRPLVGTVPTARNFRRAGGRRNFRVNGRDGPGDPRRPLLVFGPARSVSGLPSAGLMTASGGDSGIEGHRDLPESE
jgi:hypothetical protein